MPVCGNSSGSSCSRRFFDELPEVAAHGVASSRAGLTATRRFLPSATTLTRSASTRMSRASSSALRPLMGPNCWIVLVETLVTLSRRQCSRSQPSSAAARASSGDDGEGSEETLRFVGGARPPPSPPTGPPPGRCFRCRFSRPGSERARPCGRCCRRPSRQRRARRQTRQSARSPSRSRRGTRSTSPSPRRKNPERWARGCRRRWWLPPS